MGHLTRIANTVVHNLEKGPIHTQISNLISGVLEAHGNIIFALYLQMSPSHTHTHTQCLRFVIFFSCCRAARGLQRALGNLCGSNTVRNQQEEYY